MNNPKIKVLIIDDDRTVCSSLDLLLRRKGYEVCFIHHPSVAIESIAEFKPDLILLDMNFTIDTSGKQGLKLLRQIRENNTRISVILMTGWATVQLAVEGMKLGAKDFIAKPWDNKDLLSSIQSIEALHHIDKTSKGIPSYNKSNIIGQSKKMEDIMDMVDRVAKTQASVLVTGESGTGKELIAEAIHERSLRNGQPFVKVNLGSIPSTLFESEMFGHLKGAFTGAHADREGRFSTSNNGTIFLDEIGELDMECQVKLLRVLQEKTFEKLGSSKTEKTDVRVVAATNRNLMSAMSDGSFREDLYYRINLLEIHLPPLRDRTEDIPDLVKYFLSNVAALYATDIPYLDEDTLAWLSMQEYKGNIRQLKNIIERTFLLQLRAKELTKKSFLSAFNISDRKEEHQNALNLQSMEVNTIEKALAKHDHSISAAARALGITRSSLYRRIEKYGISHEPKI